MPLEVQIIYPVRYGKDSSPKQTKKYGYVKWSWVRPRGISVLLGLVRDVPSLVDLGFPTIFPSSILSFTLSHSLGSRATPFFHLHRPPSLTGKQHGSHTHSHAPLFLLSHLHGCGLSFYFECKEEEGFKLDFAAFRTRPCMRIDAT